MHAFLDATKPLTTNYGAVVGLSALGAQVCVALLLLCVLLLLLCVWWCCCCGWRRTCCCVCCAAATHIDLRY